MKIIRGLEHFSEDRLRDLWLLRLEMRRLWGHPVAMFWYLKGAYKKAGQRLCTRVCSDRTKGENRVLI